MKPLLLSIMLIGLLVGCGKDPYGADPKAYENDLTEEAFRFLFDRFPHNSEEIAYCVVWGYKIAPVPERFIARFTDIKRDVVSYSDVDTAVIGTNVTFRLKKGRYAVALPVAMFQVVLLPRGGDGKRTMEVAWTYQNWTKRELVAVDESRPGLAKFGVIHDITPGGSKQTEPDGPANGSQPFRPQTNSTPSAAGSRR